MLHAMLALLGCQLAGEIIARGIGLPVPGPVIGMGLLAAALLLRPAWTDAIRPTADGLLGVLSLLFVPAGVGVVDHLDRLGPDGPALFAALVVSTLLGLAVTMATFAALARRSAGPDGTGTGSAEDAP